MYTSYAEVITLLLKLKLQFDFRTILSPTLHCSKLSTGMAFMLRPIFLLKIVLNS